MRKAHCTLYSHMDVLAGKLAAGGCAKTAGGMLARVIQMMCLGFELKFCLDSFKVIKMGHCVVAHFKRIF